MKNDSQGVFGLRTVSFFKVLWQTGSHLIFLISSEIKKTAIANPAFRIHDLRLKKLQF